MPDPHEYSAFDLLCQAIRLDDENKAVSAVRIILENNRVDWEDLYTRAELHSIRPQLAKLMGKISGTLVEHGFTDKINTAYRQNLYNQLNYLEQFFIIRDLLKVENITIIPFKGFWLAHDVYSGLADRESLDVDVFTSTTSLTKIKMLMESAGFTEEESYTGFTIEEIIKRFQEYIFERIENNRKIFRIEFHWGISLPGYGMGIRLEDLESQIVSSNIQGKKLEVFTPSANLLLTVLHHGGKDRFIMLKQVLDIANILRTHTDIDWEWLFKEAKRFHAEKLVYVGVNLAVRLTGIIMPEKIRSGCKSHYINKLTDNRIRQMNKSPDKWFTLGFNINNWFFRISTLNGIVSGFSISMATVKAVLLNYFKK